MRTSFESHIEAGMLRDGIAFGELRQVYGRGIIEPDLSTPAIYVGKASAHVSREDEYGQFGSAVFVAYF